MLLNEHSIQFKIMLLCAWILPYVLLLVATRNWRDWAEMLFTSMTSAILFSLSFMTLWVSLSDFFFFNKGLQSVPRILLGTLPGMIILFPGLVLIIALTSLCAIITRKNLPLVLALGIACLFAHALYLANVVIRLMAINFL
jgi:hypothetical protein